MPHQASCALLGAAAVRDLGAHGSLRAGRCAPALRVLPWLLLGDRGRELEQGASQVWVHTGMWSDTLTVAFAEGHGCVIVGQGAEVLSLDTCQVSPGGRQVVSDRWLGHGLVHMAVLSCHLPNRHAGTNGASAFPPAHGAQETRPVNP